MVKKLFIVASVFCATTAFAETKTLVCIRQETSPLRFYSQFEFTFSSDSSARLIGSMSRDGQLWRPICKSVGDFHVATDPSFAVFSGTVRCQESQDSSLQMKLDLKTKVLNTKLDMTGLEYQCEWPQK